jgi:hypothetical protein
MSGPSIPVLLALVKLMEFARKPNNQQSQEPQSQFNGRPGNFVLFNVGKSFERTTANKVDTSD